MGLLVVLGVLFVNGLMRYIGSQPSLAPFIAEELARGPSAVSDKAIDRFISKTAITLHHPAGACKMAVDIDPLGVLDQQFRVRGVDGLRVIDGSAMPKVIRGPINASIIMMAEKAADLIRGVNG